MDSDIYIYMSRPLALQPLISDAESAASLTGVLMYVCLYIYRNHASYMRICLSREMISLPLRNA